MMRESPGWQILVGGVMLVLGLALVGEVFQDPPRPGDSPFAPPKGQENSRQWRRKPPGPKLAVGLVFAVCGAGLGLYGFRRAKHEGQLLRDGVPVTGRIVHIHREPKRSSRITYRFVDDDGGVHEGIHVSLLEGGLVEGFEEGQEVTVVYDARDPRRHVLDVDHVRRADAALRRL
ncbi:MAG TPA: DUF3592 domain-containing protein [Myxococcus sp.]|nr:DUF3592 domain-containing protein [Myxococcus sp.]